MSLPPDHKTELDDLGYTTVDTCDFDMSTQALSWFLTEFVQSCNFKSGEGNYPTTPMWFGDFVSEIARHEKDDEHTALLYKFLPTVPLLYKFASQKSLIQTLHRLGVKRPCLGTVPLVRIDRPHQVKYMTPWHQDYWFSFSSQNSVVVWFPLAQLTHEQGLLRVLPRSHLTGPVPYLENEGRHEPLRPKFQIDETECQEVDVDFGKLLAFKQTLLHRSGVNVSNRCRVTVQLRFNDMHEQDYPHATFYAEHSEHVQRSQSEFASRNEA